MIAALIASILVTFPAENQKLLVTDRAYVIGAAETNRKERLYLNGVEVDVYRTGAFLSMVKTHPGTNTLEFAQGTNLLVRSFVVASPLTQGAAKAEPPKPCDPYETLGIPTNAVFAAKPPKGSRPADVLVVAIGRAEFLTKDMVKPGAVVIDVGINRLPDGRLCGDVKFDEVSELSSYITPVPGGVGPMTITMLLRNTLTAAKKQSK